MPGIGGMMSRMGTVRALEELVGVDDPAWPHLRGLVDLAAAPVVVLPVDEASAGRGLFRLQVTAGSFLGALALHTGGLIVDGGWLRILGGGGGGLIDLATANGLDEPSESTSPPAALIVAFDVLGGSFAINGGGLPGSTGEVCYWGPDTLQWTPLGSGHSGFVQWALQGSLDDFYADLRWPQWQDEVNVLALDEGLAVYPFPFTEQGRDIASAKRSRVPFTELLAVYQDLARQTEHLPDGSTVNVVATD